jgi:predicted ATP-dependent protease
MLRDDVTEAVRAGRFRVVAVDNVDEAAALLMAGGDGWPDESEIGRVKRELGKRVRHRLNAYTRTRTRHALSERGVRRVKG